MKNPFKPKHIGSGYLLRWHLIPRNRFFNIYLHKFIGDDDARALHDHPWNSFSIKLWGDMWEIHNDHKLNGWRTGFTKDQGEYMRYIPRFRYRKATFAHRLELLACVPAWTLFFTGPVIRDWGFHCLKGWQHWSTMTTKDGKTIGGCE